MTFFTELVFSNGVTQTDLLVGSRRHLLLLPKPFFYTRKHYDVYKLSRPLINISFVHNPALYSSFGMGVMTGKTGNLPVFVAGKGFRVLTQVLCYAGVLYIRVTAQAVLGGEVKEEVRGAGLSLFGNIGVTVKASELTTKHFLMWVIIILVLSKEVQREHEEKRATY